MNNGDLCGLYGCHTTRCSALCSARSPLAVVPWLDTVPMDPPDKVSEYEAATAYMRGDIDAEAWAEHCRAHFEPPSDRTQWASDAPPEANARLRAQMIAQGWG